MTRLLDAILATMLLEWVVLARIGRGRTLPARPRAIGLHLGAGAALVLASRQSTAGRGRAQVLGCLSLALALHLADLRAGGWMR